MFTGIVTDIGTVAARGRGQAQDRQPLRAREHGLGGIDCLRRLLPCHGGRQEGADGGAMFEVDVSNGTVARTTLGHWKTGRRINSSAR